MAAPSTKQIEIEWRIHILMAEKNIRTNTELHERLARAGFAISLAQLGRVVNTLPLKLNTHLLLGLLTVLECNVEDLIRIKDASSC